MLSSAKISCGSWRYYTQGVACQATDYYLGHGEAPGRWHGRGLPALDLVPGSVVSEPQLEALFARALHPSTGQRLGNAWRKDNAVTGFDLTFSAPKGASALWALGNEEVATAVKAAHQAAVRAGLGYLDSHASLSRRGTNGVAQIASGGMTAALFDHRTSREGDPQLHTHALVVNKVRCVDGDWRTLDARDLFAHKKSAGMIYQAALRNELSQRLDVDFGPVDEHGQAEILGIPAGLSKLWSKRTKAIDAEAAPKIAEYEKRLGRTLTRDERASVVKTAVLKTRPAKTDAEPVSLRASWVAEAERAGFSADAVLYDVGPLQAAPAAGLPVSADEEAARVLAGLQAAGQQQAVFSRADVAGQVAAHLATTGLTAAEVAERVEVLTDQALSLDEAVLVGAPVRDGTPRASDARYATVQVLSAEDRILTLARQGRLGRYGQVPDNRVTGAAALASGLDVDQRYALGRLTGGGDFLSVLSAPAGAGKTSTLGAAALAWEQAGYRVIGLAPSARAAAELATATGDRTDTLAKWLHNQSRLGQLRPAERAWTELDERTVLIVDEASMASTLDLDTLTALAARSAAKVVLVGDPGQIGVINGPGGMLAALAHAGHGVELGQIHRFTADWERQASLGLRKGDPAVLGVYGAHGRLHACPDGDSALEHVFTHWTRARADGQDALMLARTRIDVDALNARARTAALAAGQVHGPVTHAGDRDWQAGDLLRTRRNHRHLTLTPHADPTDPAAPGPDAGHVRNGDRFRVLGPGPAGGLIAEELTGRGRVVLPADYLTAHVEYGWASTIDSAQGATADLGIVLVRPGMDREHLYVAMTRGRHGNHAYITPDPTRDPEQHGHGPALGRDRHRDSVEALRQDAAWVLRTAVQHSGAQDAAHTALATARAEAAERERAAAERARAAAAERARAAEAARRQAARAEAQRRAAAPQPLPREHQQTLQALADWQAHRDQLQARQRQLQDTLGQTQQQLQDLSRWTRHHRQRRDSLTADLSTTQQQLRDVHGSQSTAADEIERLTLRAAHQARERDTATRASAAVRQAWAATWGGTGLIRPTLDPTTLAARIRSLTPDDPIRTASTLPPPYRGPEPPRGPGRGR